MYRKMLALPAALVLMLACQKELSKEDAANAVVPPQGTQALSLYLTDDPALFDSVVVNILQVSVRVDTCSGDDDDDDLPGTDDDSCKAWFNLDVQPGMYDLLTLRNGVDTLLASGQVPDGKIQRVRISLGEGHYLVKDQVRYPLALMPGRNRTIDIKMKHEDWDQFSSRRRQLWLDFDVARSVVRVRDGVFYLIPVIRPFTLVKTGTIEGRVLPQEAQSVISVYNATDTAYALPDRKGEFKVRGLKAGSYTLWVNAGNGYADSTVNNIAVANGRETGLATIILRK